MRRVVGALALAVALIVTGCADSEPEFDEPAATAEVTEAWETWFDASVPLDDKIDLIEFGPQLRETSETAAENPGAADLNAEVSSVEFNQAHDQAEVTYDLYNGEDVLLPGANGLAVLVEGEWKVSALSYCELLALAGTICPEEVREGTVADWTRQDAPDG